MSNHTDQDIIRLCRDPQTKERGFRILLSQYKERTYWHIRRILLDHEDANDITQDTFVKVWQNLDSFRGDSSLFSWIYRISTNESLNFLRKMKKMSTVPIEKVEYLLVDKLDNNNLIDGDDIEIKLQRYLLKLPEKQRLVFNMRYFEELKYKEISEILGTSVGGLKASYHHAIKKIEENLKID
ncbi:MAG: RNA polymerase subunit sigma [Bacteroidetes bacterium]|nr:MAG: RNA polymerase subunit sigma [Bacteroidota bacterium]